MIEPEAFTRLSLEENGTDLLMERVQASLESRALGDDEHLQKCIQLAIEMHSEDARTYEPYNNHLLRVLLILVETFGIDDPDILKAAILHDILEDHPLDLARKHRREDDLSVIQRLESTPLKERMGPKDRGLKRTLGASALMLVANSSVRGYVEAVSNPVIDNKEQKNEIYTKHIQDLVNSDDLGGIVIKLADFIDNAFVPPGEPEDPNKRRRLDHKQLPIYKIFIEKLPRLNGLIAEEEIQATIALLEEGERLARRRLSG